LAAVAAAAAAAVTAFRITLPRWRPRAHASNCGAIGAPWQAPPCPRCPPFPSQTRPAPRTGRFAGEVLKTTAELEAVVTVVIANSRQMPRRDPLRPYMDLIAAAAEADSPVKPSQVRAGIAPGPAARARVFGSVFGSALAVAGGDAVDGQSAPSTFVCSCVSRLGAARRRAATTAHPKPAPAPAPAIPPLADGGPLRRHRGARGG
jgi:hypothetical protein